MPVRDPTLDLFSSAVVAADSAPVTGPAAVRATVPPPAGRLRELWLAVSLPALSLEALSAEPAAGATGRGGSPAAPPRAIAVVDPERDQTVIACNACAARAGIVPGLGLNAAHALIRQLEVRARDRRREQALLECLASGGGAFTPRVVVVEPDALLLEVRGSLRLFGGIEALGARLRQWLEEQRVTPVLAAAPTPLAALWLARAEGGETTNWPRVAQLSKLPGRLAALPLNCLRWPERVCQDLQAMGVDTVGDCLRLPRDGFARRFGPGLLEDLDRALGRVPDVRRAHVPRRRYSAGLELEHEITDVPRLVRALGPLLLTMGDFLRKRQCCLRGFELRLQHRSMPATRLIFRLVAPAVEAAHFIELVAARLERILLPAPVHRVRLRSGVLIPIDAAMVAMTDAFTGARADIDPVAGVSLARRQDPLRVPRLVERLRARLCVAAVHGLCLVPEHRPESASKVPEPRVKPHDLLAWSRQPRSSRREPQTRIELGTPRPLWLLCEPQPLAVEQERPCCDGPLVLEQGPERIESGWWDGADVARDYYVARTPAGLRLWIYRERRAERRWFLHGVFA